MDFALAIASRAALQFAGRVPLGDLKVEVFVESNCFISGFSMVTFTWLYVSFA